MKKFKVRVTCGTADAPWLLEFADKMETAILQAKKRSGLSRFNNWFFIGTEI